MLVTHDNILCPFQYHASLKCCSLKCFLTVDLPALLKSSSTHSNKTSQLVEWSSHLTQIITAAILFIELSYSVFTPECDSTLPRGPP